MEKVKLPREVAEAIERYWSLWSHEAHLKHIQLTNWSHMYDQDIGIHRILVSYAKENPVEYMQALVNGYEVEQTPGDKVREYYQALECDTHSIKYPNDSAADVQHHALTRAEMRGILGTLDRLNIKISGVNTE